MSAFKYFTKCDCPCVHLLATVDFSIGVKRTAGNEGDSRVECVAWQLTSDKSML